MNNSNVSAKQIMLNYFNNVLFDKGIITEQEKNKMVNIIYKDCQKSANMKNKSNL